MFWAEDAPTTSPSDSALQIAMRLAIKDGAKGDRMVACKYEVNNLNFLRVLFQGAYSIKTDERTLHEEAILSQASYSLNLL